MALINDIYVLVTDESLNRDVETSSHPVESGIDITDTVKRKAMTLSISGLIADYPTGRKVIKIVPTDSGEILTGAIETAEDEYISASTVISRLENLKNTGGLVKYIGRNLCDKMQITSFETSHPNTVWGGAEFSMTLQECRIVKNAYVAPKINESSVKNGGEKQVEKGESNEVWYTVKAGDTIWELVVEKKVNGKWVAADYKNLRRDGAVSGGMGACNWVMEKNPNAFSKKGDFGTLKIGAKILLGYKRETGTTLLQKVKGIGSKLSTEQTGGLNK